MKTYTRKILAMFLTLAVLLCGLPVTAMAEGVGITGNGPVASPGTTGQAAITFNIPLNESGETAFYLPENKPITDADLLNGVTAADENGDPVTVTVKATDGLDMANPQMRGAYPNPPYEITYAAAHPVSGEVFTETRELFVTLGQDAIMPLAGGNENATWDSSTNATINTTVAGWDSGGNTITVGSGASGTLTIPSGLTELTINGGGNTISGSIYMSNTVSGAITLNLNNVTINSDNANGAIYRNHSDQLTLNITGSVKLNGQAGGGHALNASYLTIGGAGTLYATGGSGTTQGGNGILSQGNIENSGTIAATGGNGINGGNGGTGIMAASIINGQGGTITATGGTGGDSATGTGGTGGIGVSATGTIENNMNNSASAFRAAGGAGGAGGSGNTSGTGGQAANGTLTNVLALPTVTFAAQGGVNLNSPSNLVFKVSNAALLSAYKFVSVRFELAPGRGNTIYPEGSTYNNGITPNHDAVTGLTYNSATGELTIPAAAFVTHASPSGFGSRLSAGNYTAIITFGDNQNTPAFTFAYNCTFTLTDVFDAGSDAHFSFQGNYANLAKVLLNGTELNQDFINLSRAYLNGYGGYAGNLGLVEEGSVKVTLYKEFLRTLSNGTYTLMVEFNDGSRGSLQFQIQQQASLRSGSSSGSSKRANTPVSTWLERDPAAALAENAKNRGKDYARTKITGIYGVRGDAWDRLAGLTYQHDTMDDGAVDVRLYINSPENLKKDIRVSGYVKGVDVDNRKAFFEKWFKNKLRTIYFDHQGAWGQPVDVAARVDLTDMDTKNLCFYAYDKATNSYRSIKNPAYWIDKNGYLHFTSELAGNILISEGPLERR